MVKYEIDMSTLMIMSISENTTRIITIDDDFIVNDNSLSIIDNSCRFFGNSLKERINVTKRLVNISSKSPIVIEESRCILFFPLKSTREKENIWISYNNLDTYVKNDDKTIFRFKCGKVVEIKFSYYIIDNQVTRSLILDYEYNKRRKSLEK